MEVVAGSLHSHNADLNSREVGNDILSNDLAIPQSGDPGIALLRDIANPHAYKQMQAVIRLYESSFSDPTSFQEIVASVKESLVDTVSSLPYTWEARFSTEELETQFPDHTFAKGVVACREILKNLVSEEIGQRSFRDLRYLTAGVDEPEESPSSFKEIGLRGVIAELTIPLENALSDTLDRLNLPFLAVSDSPAPNLVNRLEFAASILVQREVERIFSDYPTVLPPSVDVSFVRCNGGFSGLAAGNEISISKEYRKVLGKLELGEILSKQEQILASEALEIVLHEGRHVLQTALAGEGASAAALQASLNIQLGDMPKEIRPIILEQAWESTVGFVKLNPFRGKSADIIGPLGNLKTAVGEFLDGEYRTLTLSELQAVYVSEIDAYWYQFSQLNNALDRYNLHTEGPLPESSLPSDDDAEIRSTPRLQTLLAPGTLSDRPFSYFKAQNSTDR